MNDRPAPAGPPSPLTAEEAVEKALLYTFNWSDKQYAKMRGALTERAFIRALEQDGYTVATLDAARAPDAGLRAALRECIDYARLSPTGERRSRWEAALASSPAPAGLDEQRCPECDEWRHEYNAAVANGLIETARTLDRRIAAHERDHRAATRPAEDAGERP